MTTAMIVILLASAAAALVVLLIVVAVAQSLNKTGTPTPAETAAAATAYIAAQMGKTQTTAAPAQKPGRTPKTAKGHSHHASAASASVTRTAAKDAAAAAKDPKKNTKDTFAGFAAIGGLIAVAGGVISFLAGLNDGDIAPEIKDLRTGALHGTMVNARNSDPIVLIVPGSGPTDRDGNNPMGLKTDAYRLLAEGLIDKRIASVRIDKRGMFGSKDAGDPNAVTPAAYVADIHAWIDAIKADRGENSGCVFLLGHSEGALMVTLAAQERKDVCGLILVAGMGRPMGAIIREQLKANPANAPILDEAFAALAELEAGRRVDTTSMTPALQPLFDPSVQGYLMSVLTVDPVEALRAARKETLVLQGDRDLQVAVEDARKLDSVRNTELRIIGGMNHVLKDAPEDRAGNLATYADPSLPLSNDIIRRIRSFVKDND